MEIANEQPFYTASKHIELLKKSLSIVPIYLTDEDDYLLVDGEYPTEFVKQFTAYGWKIPNIITQETTGRLKGLKINSFEPWGWSPSVIKKIEKLQSTNEFIISHLYEWNKNSKEMFSRFPGRELCKILKNNIVKSHNLSIPQLPIIVKNLTDLEIVESEMKAPLLIKTPWSASGRGLFNIRDNNEKSYENPWVKAKLKEQKSLFVEPLLNKIQDLSFHFYKNGKSIEFIGVNFFKTESDGKFKGCYVNFYNHPDFNAKIIKREAIDEAEKSLLSSLKCLKNIENYDGYIGIDALFFYDKNGEVKLHPAIEINLRKTMGLINLQIEKRISSNSFGFWEIIPMEEFPINAPVENKLKDGKLVSGIFPLSPIDLGGSVVMVLRLDI